MSSTLEQAREEVQCPACAEPVLVAAKKCKHCGEWIEEKEVVWEPPTSGPTRNDLQTSEITIERSTGYSQSGVPLNVFLEDRRIATLKDGESTKVSLPYGRHLLRFELRAPMFPKVLSLWGETALEVASGHATTVVVRVEGAVRARMVFDVAQKPMILSPDLAHATVDAKRTGAGAAEATPQRDEQIRRNIKKFSNRGQLYCLECGYDGPAGIVRSVKPWYGKIWLPITATLLNFFIIAPFSVSRSGASSSLFVLLFWATWFFVHLSGGRPVYMCPACSTEVGD